MFIHEKSFKCPKFEAKHRSEKSKGLCELDIEYEDGFGLYGIMLEDKVELYNQFGNGLSTLMTLGYSGTSNIHLLQTVFF